MSLSISNNGLALIKKFEGCRLTAYQDSVGVWTIGYGHTSGVRKGQIITQAQADAFLKADCASAEKAVNSYSKYNWNQNQFDALVSFTFNCGSGNLKTLLNNGQRTIAEISAKITAYNKAGGKVLQGLVNRRIAEKELFDKPISSITTPPLSSTSAPTTTKFVKPVSYLQTDPKWKNHNYSAKGEFKTIGSSGCGVTAAAMVIATLKDKNVTPVTTAEWSMEHGYKALNQGTYYTYFVPQMSKYGITCKRLNATNLYGQSSSTAHTEALNALKNKDLVIACMGKGNWTSSGHFILVYGFENGYIYINDPASTASNRIKNTWALFAKQVKYLWTITVPDSFKSLNNTSSSSTNATTNSLINVGLQHAKNFTGIDDSLNISKAKGRVLQRGLNLDYGKSITEDGVVGSNTKKKLNNHYVEFGEKQYMITALEILFYLNGIDPGGLELPGIYGKGLVNAVKNKFGGTGQKVTTSNFLTLVK